MSKKATLFLFSCGFVIMFIAIVIGTMRREYYPLLDRLTDQYALEKLTLAEQIANTLEDEIKSTEDKLKLMAALPEIQEAETEKCNQKLVEVAGLNPRMSNLGRVNIDQTFACSLNPALVGVNATTLGPYISEIFADPEHKTVMSRLIKVPSGQYAVAVHVPVYTPDGEFDGTLGGAIYFDSFGEIFLKDVQVADQGYVVLQDDNGTIFYHPQTELIGQNRRPKTPQEEATASAITSLIAKSAVDGSSGTSRYVSSLDQTEKVGAYAAADVFPGRRWVVIVTVPIENILEWPLILNAEKAFAQLFFLLISVIVISQIAFLLYLVISIFKPLEKIGKAATEIGKGNLDVRIPITSNDEMGKVATLFNSMAGQLKTYYHDLEQAVALKTQELSTKLTELEENRNQTLKIMGDLADSKSSLEFEMAKDDAIFSSIGDGVVVLDENGNVSRANPHALTLLGYTEAELLGQQFAQIIKSLDETETPISSEVRPAFEALQTGKIITKRLFYIRKDGSKLPVTISISPIMMDGKAIGAVEVFRDTTRENELEKLKDEFVSIASHELRTPLTAIDGIVSMILDGEYGEVSEHLKAPLTDVTTSSERLINLVNDLLNLSRINAGRMKYVLSDFDVSGVVQEVVKLLQPVTKGRQVKLVTDNLQNVNVQADIDKVKQVLNNVIGNALKFTDSGEVKVEMRITNDLVEVLVTDTGIGISIADQAKLFGQFQQLDSGKGRPTGTGLGLHISKEIATRMGGDLWISRSEKGVGSTFIFTIPKSGTSLAKSIKTEIDAAAVANPNQRADIIK